MTMNMNESDQLLNEISLINEVLGENSDSDLDSEDNEESYFHVKGVHEITDEDERDGIKEENLFLGELEHCWENCLGLNKAYQEVLQDNLRKLQSLLAENLGQQEYLSEEIESSSNELLHCYQRGVSLFLHPYFHDKNGRIPSQNEDVLEKAASKEKSFQVLKPKPWLRWELKLLKKVAIEECVAKRLKPHVSRIELLREKSESPTIAHGVCEVYKEEIEKLENEIKDKKLNKADCLYERFEELDWMKISVIDFGGERSPEECELMWNNLLHPSINKDSWNLEEDSLLEEAVTKGGIVNWDFVSAYLKSHRTPYQCFVRYVTTFKTDDDLAPWSNEEDEKLKVLINRLSVGSYIPWLQVEQCMKGRTRVQIYNRWRYALNPKIKKGFFTQEEDILILAGAQLFGDNFYKISRLIPGRTSSQIGCRYKRLQLESQDSFGAPWSRQEDQLLLETVQEGQILLWTAVAEKFPGRSGDDCRRRFISICHNCSRNPNILYESNLPLGLTPGRKSKRIVSPEVLAKVEDMVKKLTNKQGAEEFLLTQKDVKCKDRISYSKTAIKFLKHMRKRAPGRKGKVMSKSEAKFHTMMLASTVASAGRPRSYSTPEAVDMQVMGTELVCRVLNVDIDGMNVYDPSEDEELNELDAQLFSILKMRVLKGENSVEEINAPLSCANESVREPGPSDGSLVLAIHNYASTVDESNVREGEQSLGSPVSGTISRIQYVRNSESKKIIVIPPNVMTLGGFRGLLIHRSTLWTSSMKERMRESVKTSRLEGSFSAAGTNPVGGSSNSPASRHRCYNKRRNHTKLLTPIIGRIDPPVIDVDSITLKEDPSQSCSKTKAIVEESLAFLKVPSQNSNTSIDQNNVSSKETSVSSYVSGNSCTTSENIPARSDSSAPPKPVVNAVTHLSRTGTAKTNLCKSSKSQCAGKARRETPNNGNTDIRTVDTDLFDVEEVRCSNSTPEQQCDFILLKRLYSVFYWPALMSTATPEKDLFEDVALINRDNKMPPCPRAAAKTITDAIMVAESTDSHKVRSHRSTKSIRKERAKRYLCARWTKKRALEEAPIPVAKRPKAKKKQQPNISEITPRRSSRARKPKVFD